MFLRTHFLSWHSSAWSTGQERCNISSSFRARSQRCCSWEECPPPNHRRTWDLSVCHGSHVWKCLTHIVPCEVLWVLAYFESSLVSLCTALPPWLLKQHFPFSLCWFCLFFFSDFSEDVSPLVSGVAHLWPEFICGSVDRVDGLHWARAFGEKGFPCDRAKPVLLVLVFGLFTLRVPASLSPWQVKLSVVFSFWELAYLTFSECLPSTSAICWLWFQFFPWILFTLCR